MIDQLAGPVGLALFAAAGFAGALIVTQFGLRHATTYTGATISLTTTFIVWCALAPFLLDVSAWHVGAVAIFATVGAFYPAAVTVLTYESNRLLGPTLTGTVSSTAPLFAIALAVLVLGEELTAAVVIGGLTIVSALVLLSWHRPAASTQTGWRLLLPLAGAALRGLAQTLIKLGLALWPNPFAATLIGYTVSGAAIWSLRIARREESPARPIAWGFAWFVAAGVLNGGAVLLMYHALRNGRVGIVAPIVALYPLFTMLFSALFLKTEPLGSRTLLGTLIAVIGVVMLVAG